jgi:hypothetical protein
MVNAGIVIWVELLYDKRAENAVSKLALVCLIKIFESFAQVFAFIAQAFDLEDSTFASLLFPEEALEEIKNTTEALLTIYHEKLLGFTLGIEKNSGNREPYQE